ncbi:MAG TPA: helix-turn-helix domain-containing protein [Clostridiales bacterium]|nr:helix-turn-helix domain-containing protein [Clostridiales bacterium]
MDNNSVYEYLLEANEWERKALEYIRRHGKKPSGKDLLMIYSSNVIPGYAQDGESYEDWDSEASESWESKVLGNKEDKFVKNREDKASRSQDGKSLQNRCGENTQDKNGGSSGNQEVWEGYRRYSESLHSLGRIVYQEEECFLPGSNIELCKVERYVDNVLHTHEFFEVEYVLKGSCIHIVEKQEIPIREGDIVIIPPNVEHKALPEDDGVTVNIKIRKRVFHNAFINLLSTDTELSTYLSRTLYSTAYRSSFTFHCGGDPSVKSIILSMYGQQLEQKPFFNYMLEGMTLTLFSCLMQNHSQNVEISNFVITSDDRMSKIIAYINENYRNVTLSSVAGKFYISEPYLSSIIKKETGSTFSSLLREIKIQKATMLLLTTNLNIDEVCERSGYQDTTQFIKTFKKYHGLSPKRYRQSMQQMSKAE